MKRRLIRLTGRIESRRIIRMRGRIVTGGGHRMKYEVQTKHDGAWSNEVGEPNVFGSEAEAEKAIAELQALGDDWLDAEYRVEEVVSP
jgi:hypothetical protein